MIDSTYGTMYYVDDMEKAVSFYKGAFGIQPGYESKEWTEFPMNGHNLCLHEKRAGETYTPNGVLIVKKDGVKNLFEKMKGDGFNVYGLHEIHDNTWSFHFKDGSQNEVSIYGKGE
jgi:predicted enzyme related to lactoylglutathione lyase